MSKKTCPQILCYRSERDEKQIGSKSAVPVAVATPEMRWRKSKKPKKISGRLPAAFGVFHLAKAEDFVTP